MLFDVPTYSIHLLCSHHKWQFFLSRQTKAVYFSRESCSSWPLPQWGQNLFEVALHQVFASLLDIHQFLQFGDNLWVHHVILKGCPMLNLATNFVYLFTFCILPCQKKNEFLCKFWREITNPFLNLQCAPKWISQE